MQSNPGQIDNDHLAQLGSDDRIAVMRMVAEGELSVDEAVVRASRGCPLRVLLRQDGTA